MSFYVGDKKTTLHSGSLTVKGVYMGTEKIDSGATPYTVNFTSDATNVSKYSNVGASMTVAATYVSVSYSGASWSGGFPTGRVTFRLPTKGCTKFTFSVSNCSGSYHDVTINGTTYSNNGTYTIPVSGDSISVQVAATSYASSGSTGHSASVSMRNASFSV